MRVAQQSSHLTASDGLHCQRPGVVHHYQLAGAAARRQPWYSRPACPTALPASTSATRSGHGQLDHLGSTEENQLTDVAVFPAAAPYLAPGKGTPPPPGASALPPSRLQQEADLLVGLDVEYTHLKLLPGGRQLSLPAEVCAVDAAGRVLLYEHCNPLGPEQALLRWRHMGGANPALWRHAPPLADLRCQLAALLRGRVLVGHHLRKDLRALQLEHPTNDLRDTLQYRELQGRRGRGRTLRQLSAEKLGRTIQRSGRRHSPREDAQAALDLYLREVHWQPQYMQYDDMVQEELVRILGSAGAQPADGQHSSSDAGPPG